MKHFYCSAFSGSYCYQGLVLYNSLEKLDNDFTVFFLCLDSLAFEIFTKLQLKNIKLIKAEQVEAYFPELIAAKQDRTINEYAWTIKSSELRYIFESYPQVDRLIWLDGDTQFLSNPEVIFKQWADYSVILTEQYYTDSHEPLTLTYGRFQAGFIGFKKDAYGIQCLKWWQSKCLNWCYATFEAGRWADQKYLDDIPELCPNTYIIKDLGINTTPFILYRLNFEQEKYIESSNDELIVNNTKLVLFHYYGFRYFDDSSFDLCNYWMKFSRNTVEHIYIPYFKACSAAVSTIENLMEGYGQRLQSSEKHVGNYFNACRNDSNSSYDIATIVNKRMLQEAVALYLSMEKQGEDYYLWFCCMDLESYYTLKALKLKNASVVFVDNLLDRAQRIDMKNKPDSVNYEMVKQCFLYYLLKNNYAIRKLLLVKSSYYIFESLEETFSKLGDKNAILYKQGRKGSANQAPGYYKDIVCLANDKTVTELLEYCIQSLKGLFLLNDKIAQYLNYELLNGIEYCCRMQDIKYNSVLTADGRLYINQYMVKAFVFNESANPSESSSKTEKKARNYLNKSLYNQLYNNYINDLRKASHILSKVNS